MKKISNLFLVLLFTLPSFVLAQEFNVLKYGAVNNKQKLSTSGIQKAIDACHKAGGGTVVVPAGEYTSGTIHMRSNVSFLLQLGATIYASKNPADYTPQSHGAGDVKTVNILISALNCENIKIYGKGKLHGQAEREQFTRQAEFDPYEHITGREIANAAKYGADYRTKYRRIGSTPGLLNITGCTDVMVHDIQLIESGTWTFHIQWCQRVFVRGVYIESSEVNGVNSDGLDIDGSQQVVVSDCIINTGDDALCIKTTRLEGKSMPVEDLTITNCILRSSSSAFKIGTESHSDFKRITMSNCVINGANRGLGMIIRDGGTASDIIFSNIVIKTERKATFWWGNGDPIWLVVSNREPSTSGGTIRNVTFHNIYADGMSGMRVEGFDNAIEDLKFNNVNLMMTHESVIDKRSKHGFHFHNVKNLSLTECEVKWDEKNPESVWDKAFNFEKIENLYLDKIKAKAAPNKIDIVGISQLSGDFENRGYIEIKK